jgi:ureidoglycolate lyase
MKLLRYGPKGQEKPGVLDAEARIRDLSGVVRDIAGEALAPASLEKLKALDLAQFPVVEGTPRIGPCVGAVSKIVCIGLNYTDHAAETGSKIPKEPILFMKASTAINGPNDDIMRPKGSQKLDWEVELGIVIGSPTRYVAVHDALKHVAGYCTVNDVSEREFQVERGGQWVKGKSADTFAPIGPWLVTADEIRDPQALALFCEVNGQRMQDGNTANMIFPVPHLISYISHFMTLLPGDVIPTGTPAGVALGRKPDNPWLKPGDTMRTAVQGLGEQRARIVDFVE